MGERQITCIMTTTYQLPIERVTMRLSYDYCQCMHVSCRLCVPYNLLHLACLSLSPYILCAIERYHADHPTAWRVTYCVPCPDIVVALSLAQLGCALDSVALIPCSYPLLCNFYIPCKFYILLCNFYTLHSHYVIFTHLEHCYPLPPHIVSRGWSPTEYISPYRQ